MEPQQSKPESKPESTCSIMVTDSRGTTVDARWVRWRTGRKIGRTIYAMVGKTPSDDDVLIGMMDAPKLANEAIQTHNALL